MAKLILLRHLLSQWNKENRFTGWVDAPLAEDQFKLAEELAGKIFQDRIDTVYSSKLFRNMDTVARILEYNQKYPLFIHLDGGKMAKWGNFKDLSEDDIPVFVSERLNERYYGKIQGWNKVEAIKQYGEERVHSWRRGFNSAPTDGESLKDVYKRVVPFYKKYIERDLKAGKNVLVVASHNSLRALVKHIDDIPDKEIINFEIPYAGIKEYNF
jgi:2,3-bisphosphoglycerate-dependent phosphoglycerate mutase